MSQQLKPLLGKFTFGEVSPLLNARSDLQKYSAGCKTLENFIPLMQGPVQRRGGTRHIEQTGNTSNNVGANPVILIDFAYSETTSYLLEFGDGYMHVYYQGAPMWNAAGTSYYVIGTPWPQSALFDANGISKLKWVQSGDVMYIVCPDVPPKKLMRYGHTDWRIVSLGGWGSRPNATAIALFRERLCLANKQTVWMSQSGAFENFAIAEATFSNVSISSGNFTSINQATGYIQVIKGDNINMIITFVPGEVVFTRSGNVVSCTLAAGVKGFSKVSIAVSDRWSHVTVTVNSTGGSLNFGDICVIGWNPHDAELARDYAATEGWTLTPATDVISADDPIEIDVFSEQMDKIEWMVATGSLVVGTSGGEFHIAEQSTSQPLGPENIKVEPETVFGSNAVQALRVGSVLLFVQRSGKKIREFSYNLYGDNYQASDVTVAAEHVTGDGIVAMAWQSEPIETLWCVRRDGQLIGFTYSADQDMNAWHRHTLGGDGQVTHLAILPSAQGGHDELYLSVKRTINGKQVHYIERMEPGAYNQTNQAQCFFVDCGKTVVGSGMTIVDGLGYLEGKEVAILGDGGPQPNQIVTGGSVPLKYPANIVQVGLPYVSTLTTVNLDFALRDGTAQGRTKRATKVILDIINSLGGEVGRDEEIEELIYRMGYDPFGAPPALKTGHYPVLWPYGHEVEGEFTIRQKYPLPFVLRAILPEVWV